MGKPIGHIAYIKRYPVKSMQGEDIDHAYVSFNGIVGDRVYALIDEVNKGNEFPYFTVYLQKELLLYKAYLKNNAALETKLPIGHDQFTVLIDTPDHKTYKVTDKSFLALLNKKYNRKVALRFSERGMYHSRPISLVSTQSIAALQQECGLPQLEKERFRMNLYISMQNNEPYYEESLVGKHIAIGEEVELCIVKKDHRCVYTTYDPQTLAQNNTILTTIVKNHDSCFGIYASVLKGGKVSVNDSIYLL